MKKEFFINHLVLKKMIECMEQKEFEIFGFYVRGEAMGKSFMELVGIEHELEKELKLISI